MKCVKFTCGLTGALGRFNVSSSSATTVARVIKYGMMAIISITFMTSPKNTNLSGHAINLYFHVFIFEGDGRKSLLCVFCCCCYCGVRCRGGGKTRRRKIRLKKFITFTHGIFVIELNQHKKIRVFKCYVSYIVNPQFRKWPTAKQMNV